MAESKKELASMRIEAAKNGGHVVRHDYRSKATYSKSGGMGMDYPQSEEHVFGKTENAKLAAHIATHLGLKNSPDSKGAYGGAEGKEE
jgi:hypothetical protein